MIVPKQGDRFEASHEESVQEILKVTEDLVYIHNPTGKDGILTRKEFEESIENNNLIPVED